MLIFGKHCRLCTTDKDLASTLNNFDSDNIILLDKLNLIAPELLNEFSFTSLPNDICKTCITQLNQAYTFIKKCFRSQEILNRYLRQLQANFLKLCRLCTTDKDLASMLNNFDSDNIILLDKLNLIAPELLNEFSFTSLPNDICKTCITQLNQAYTFIKKCFRSQEILNRYLRQLQANFENEIKEEEIEMNHFLPNEVINESYNNSINIQATTTVKEELECLTEDTINFKNETIEEQRLCENNINDYKSTVVKYEDEITIEKHEIESCLTDLPTITEQSYFCKNNSIDFSSQVNFEDEIKAEEIDTNHFLPNDKTEIITEGCNNSVDIQTTASVKEELECLIEDTIDFKNKTIEEQRLCETKQTGQRGEEIKLENNYHDEDASEFTKTEDNNDSININNEYEITDVKDIKIEEDEFENDVVEDIPKNLENFTGFDLVECDVANRYKVKYDLKLERLAKIINNEFMKNVNKVLERREIGENSLNVNTVSQMPSKYKICEKDCKRRLNLTRHKRTRTDKKLDKPYQCAICGRATLYKSQLKIHMRMHTNKKPFKCETCNKSFTQSFNLKKHVLVHTNEKPFKCETCNKSFSQFGHLKTHVRIHTNEKPYNCETCNKCFAQSSNLKQHVRIHTNEKPFKCETCTKSFTQSSHLKQHVRVHTNENPFKCETCNKSFTQPSNLKQHVRVHTNEKPFKCETCSKSFTLSCSLKRHIIIHTNKRAFKCETCNKCFNQSSNLKRHIRIHSNKKQ